MYTIKNTQVSISVNSLVQAIFLLNDRSTENDLIRFRLNDPLHLEAYDGRQWPVAYQTGGYMGYPKLHDGQSALDWLDRMLVEVRLQTIAADGTVLPPQRMARSVWNGLQSLHELVKGYGEMFTQQQRQKDLPTTDLGQEPLITAYTGKFTTYFGYGPRGPGRNVMQSGNHEWHVAHALLRGEDLPQDILDDYATIDWVRSSNVREVDWVEHLLQKPFLRGRFKHGHHLRFVMDIAGKPDCSYKEVTAENAGYLASMLNGLPNQDPWREMDDLFYEKGILTLRPPYDLELPTLDDGVAVDDLARAIHTEIVNKARKDQLAYVEERIAQGATQRDVDYQRRRVDTIEREHSFAYPNKVARAVKARDMHFLVEVLDSSNNVSTRRAIKRVYGIELERLASAKRIREIFRLAGYNDDAEYAQARALYDTQVATAKAEQQAQQAIKDRERQRQNLTNAMNAKRVTFEGESMTMAAFLQRVIAAGHNRVTKGQRGAVPRYYLTNDAGQGYVLDAKNGELDYARMLLEQVDIDRTAATK
ncbi:hypothetical protein RQP54_17680 [Curvibacter sp. APW13]|uniref:hypothetical protein n=1 Tax=Curvibacter sp. APW13 TaxID=3077236 RepID=UPI0028DF8300|nr:hypothetical protein [Curvibacter sp. APW13]MDT8992707.1 hypothetical protein [Curvibacter sp. APW13]